MKIGNSRVSDLDQNLDLQLQALTKTDCKKILPEKGSWASYKIYALIVISIFTAIGCKTNPTNSESPAPLPAKSPSVEASPNPVPSAASAKPAAEMTAAPANLEISLVSLVSGAIVVNKPKQFDNQWSPIWLLDEKAETGWCTPKGEVGAQDIVIALSERAVLKTLIFDTGRVDCSKCDAKEIAVEVSDANDSDGFKKIAEVTLKEKSDNQRFPVAAEAPGRWVKLTVKNNHGSPNYIELMDFRAIGEQLTKTAFPDISGTYSTNYKDFHIRQEGASVTGCYEYDSGLLNGGIEGRVIKFTWKQSVSAGPAVMVFSPDGNEMFGIWGTEKGNSGRGVWYGTKKSSEVGSCPHWSGGVQEQIAKDLEEAGRARVYGINFDADSDQIKDESKPTLDKIANLLKEKPELRLVIEGHTDSLSTAEHNQNLSERRAGSVKSYLQSAGIDASRLKAVGYGAAKPVAANDAALGRAQNRRVELLKQ